MPLKASRGVAASIAISYQDMYTTVGHHTSVIKGTTKRKKRKVGPSTKKESEIISNE